jgi:hypothetical protein
VHLNNNTTIIIATIRDSSPNQLPYYALFDMEQMQNSC